MDGIKKRGKERKSRGTFSSPEKEDKMKRDLSN
jgi:hypothetical protein